MEALVERKQIKRLRTAVGGQAAWRTAVQEYTHRLSSHVESLRGETGGGGLIYRGAGRIGSVVGNYVWPQ